MSNKNADQFDHDRFDANLPFFVNGTLITSEANWMREVIATNDQANAQVLFYQRMASTMKSRFANVPENIGLDKALARIQATTPVVAASQAAPTPTKGGDQSQSGGVFDWLSNALLGHWLKPAFAFSLAVIGVQAVLLMNKPKDEPMVYRGDAPKANVNASSTSPAVYVRVSVKPTATDGEWRLVLASAKAWVVGGPGVNGEYFLRFNPADSSSGIELLKGSGLVLDVAPVDKVPNSQQ
jgi:hypothetical protein